MQSGIYEMGMNNSVDEIEPDVVHVQHLLNLSIDIVDYVKSKKVPIVYTLHDLWLECPRVKRVDKNGGICTGASLDKCSDCMHLADFVNRKSIFDKVYLKLARITGIAQRKNKNNIQKRIDDMRELVNNVDLFISPSKYLRGEFVKWGIPEDKIIYSRNGMNVVIKNEELRVKNGVDTTLIREKVSISVFTSAISLIIVVK